jgi:hypothetical protein
MSWGIEITGSKAGVAKKVVEQLDKIATTYQGKEEGKDVLAAKERILATIEALELGVDKHGFDWNAVIVKASGSHSVSDKGIWSATMTISVTRSSLALDG